MRVPFLNSCTVMPIHLAFYKAEASGTYEWCVELVVSKQYFLYAPKMLPRFNYKRSVVSDEARRR
jgi:hypothetical protein